MSLENFGLLLELKRSYIVRGRLQVGIGGFNKNGLCLNRCYL